MGELDFLAGWANAGVDLYLGSEQLELGRETNLIEAENLEFQQETQRYNEELQGRIFEREDTSVQRRVADLEAAGMSPILAAGQGARAGEAIKMNTPQRGTQGKNMQMQAYGNMKDIGKTMMEMMAIGAQVDKTKAETNLITKTTPGKVDLLAQQVATALDHNNLLEKTVISRVETIIHNRNIAKDTAYITKVKAAAAQIDGAYIKAAYKWLEKNYSNINNPYLMDIASKAVAIELQKAKVNITEAGASMATAEAKVFGTEGIGGGGSAMQIINALIRALK